MRNKNLKEYPESLRYSHKDKKLPPNFAERVLELEMEIENDCSSIDSINNLLYLYSVSIASILCMYSFLDSNLDIRNLNKIDLLKSGFYN